MEEITNRKDLHDAIKQFQELAAPLEPSQAIRQEIREKVISYTEEFLEKASSSKAYPRAKEEGQVLLNAPISERPLGVEGILKLLKEDVDTLGLNTASGNYLGYIPGGGVYYSSLGDYMAAVANRYAGVYFACPGAVEMENQLVDWMAEGIGYPKTAAGCLLSGGSIANLSAIITARDAARVKAKDYHRLVVYLSQQTHHCIDKALRIAGLEECIIRFISMDKDYRMIPDEMDKAITKDTKQGLISWLIIASAGSTDVGAVDPLEEISSIAKKHKLWYHIDAAYGGFFMLSDKGKEILKGIEKSDSVVLDPHKGLFLPYGIGALIVRDKEHLQYAFRYHANYLQDAQSDVLSPADLSPELSKHFRGLRMWLPLQLLGTLPFKACIEEKLLLAQYFYQQIKEVDGFEIGSVPNLSVVTFRYMPQQGDANAFNQQLLQEIFKDGRTFLSSTMLNGQFTLRLAILSFRTHLEHIDLALQIIKEKTAYLLTL